MLSAALAKNEALKMRRKIDAKEAESTINTGKNADQTQDVTILGLMFLNVATGVCPRAHI